MPDALLVTCVNRPPGYSLARAARQSGRFATVVGATGVSPNRLVIRSRLFDAVEGLPLPQLQRAEDPDLAERRYLDKLLSVCERHRINVVWPCNDEEIYLLSKHRETLAARGLTVLANDWAATRVAMDKFEANQIARQVGFPAPRSLRVAEGDALPALDDLAFPVMVKASRSTSSVGVRKVHDAEQLRTAVNDLLAEFAGVFIEEYVEGDREISINVLRAPDGEVLCCFGLRKFHYIHPSWSTAAEVIDLPPEVVAQAKRLLDALDLVGFVAIQTKLDVRDGELKLIEVNPRFGNITRVLLRMVPGLGEAAIDVLLGRRPTCVVGVQPGRHGVSLVDDLAAFVLYVWHRLTYRPSSDNTPPGIATMIRSYVKVYRSRPAIDDYVLALGRDPLFIIGFLLLVLHHEKDLPAEWKQLTPWGEVKVS